MSKWYVEEGPESDVVISSRVRNARNLKEFPFPTRMTKEQSKLIINKVYKVLSKDFEGKEFSFQNINNISKIEREVLVEKHLISPNLLEKELERGVFLDNKEKISIMVNEEDHFRIQSMSAGFQIKESFNDLNRIEEYLENHFEFAFNNKYGYLTSCPTNLGTGIRVSVMMHLPALVMTGYMQKIIDSCGTVGFTVRGLYGENTESTGNIFQISNQVTLGITAQEIVENTVSVAKQIIEYERNLRKDLYKTRHVDIEDKIFRSYGIFKNARKMSSDESLKLLSDIRLGIDLGLITDIKKEILNEISLNIKPASLQKIVGRELGYNERDKIRADYIRGKLNK